VIIKTFTCKLSFHSAKLKIKRSTEADLSRYYTTQSQHKPWNKTPKNRYTIPDSPWDDAVATIPLINGHDCLAAHLHRLSTYPSPICILCKEENSIMNHIIALTAQLGMLHQLWNYTGMLVGEWNPSKCLSIYYYYYYCCCCIRIIILIVCAALERLEVQGKLVLIFPWFVVH
jgi:hypothetical protein